MIKAGVRTAMITTRAVPAPLPRPHVAAAQQPLNATLPTPWVWSWDITALKGPRKGEWYKLYVVLDIFSRYVAGWLVAGAEDAVVAKDFLADALAGACHANGVSRG